MNVREQVAKLEGLLARVSSRRNAPRKAVEPEAAHAEALAEDSQVAPAQTTPIEARVAEAVVAKAMAPVAPKGAEPVVAKPVAAAVVEAKAVEPVVAKPVAPAPVEAKPAAPVQAAASAVELTARRAEGPKTPKPDDVELDFGVEVEEGVAEIDLEGLEDEAGISALSDSVADLDTVAGGDREEPPVSSQRPIRVEPPLEELAFGDADSIEAKQPPHSTPPESGRQAATPQASEDFLRSRARPAPAVAPPPAPTPVAPPAPPAALAAEVTRPVIAAASPAVFRGALPIPRPATLGELLDSTLAL
jgi:hypothetical protein